MDLQGKQHGGNRQKLGRGWGWGRAGGGGAGWRGRGSRGGAEGQLWRPQVTVGTTGKPLLVPTPGPETPPSGPAAQAYELLASLPPLPGEGPGVQVRSAQGRVRPEDTHYPSLWLPCGLLPCSASSVVSAGLSPVSVASEGALTSPPHGRHTLCPHGPPDTPGALTWALCFPAAWHHVLALYSLEPD